MFHHHHHHIHNWQYCLDCQVKYCVSCGKEESFRQQQQWIPSYPLPYQPYWYGQNSILCGSSTTQLAINQSVNWVNCSHRS